MNHDHVYAAYKELRNLIRRVPLIDSLYVIHAYGMHSLFGRAFPAGIEVDWRYLHASKEKKFTTILPWELDLLAREVILHAGSANKLDRSFRHYNHLAGAVNKLKSLNELISSTHTTPENVYRQLFRIAHQQFPWQDAKFYKEKVSRYYLLYSDKSIGALVQRRFGCSTDTLWIFFIALYGHFIKTWDHPHPVKSFIQELPQHEVDSVVDDLAISIDVLRDKIREEHSISDTFEFSSLVLKCYPLIKVPRGDGKTQLICPFPTILFNRFTLGVYYDICNYPEFSQAFGDAFQSLTGETVRRAIAGSQIRLIPEQKYMSGKGERGTVDWIVADSNAAIFIECKTKRITFNAKIESGQGPNQLRELELISDGIVQTYKSIREYRLGKFPNFGFASEVAIYPVVVTLEEWYAFGQVVDEIDRIVLRKVVEEGIDPRWIQDMPWLLCSIQELAMASWVMADVGVREFMVGRQTDEVRHSALHGHTVNRYKDRIESYDTLFGKEFDEIFSLTRIRQKLGEQRSSHEV